MEVGNYPEVKKNRLHGNMCRWERTW